MSNRRTGPVGHRPIHPHRGVLYHSPARRRHADHSLCQRWDHRERRSSSPSRLEANRGHWNIERGPRLERAIFRNDLSPAEALELCISTEGEMDIVTEVSPADAARVIASEHAKLVVCDANRVLVGIINRYPSDVPLHDKRVRKALNLAVDRQKVITLGLGGYANPLCALTPSCFTRGSSGNAC